MRGVDWVRTGEATGTSLILTGRSLGRGDDRLGELLLANYLRLLCERPQLPGGGVPVEFRCVPGRR